MSIDSFGNALASAAKSAQTSKDQAAQAKLRQACRMFESSFLQTLWKEMRATVPKGGIINGGKGEEMFTSLLDQARADKSVQGRSMGLADLLESQMSRQRSRGSSTRTIQPTSLNTSSAGAAQGLKPPAGLKTLRRQSQEEEQSDLGEQAESGQGQADLAAAMAAGVLANLTPGDSVTLPMPPLVDMEGDGPLLGGDTPLAVLGPASTTPSDLAEQQPEQKAPSALPSSGQSKQTVEFVPPIQGEVSSTFGMRVHPVSGDIRPHRGLDLAAPEGTPFQAARGGVVAYAGTYGDYGKLLVVEHDDGSQAYYGHCKSLAAAVGQKVGQGQTLGQVGQTGLATGPHLHFEIRDSSGLAVDPLPLVAGGLGLKA